ncbi:MAG TPA: hypothetical protein VGN88_11245 [Phycisphaerae bacterium]
MAVTFGAFSLDRMVNAVENVRKRLLRATSALEESKVPYAVVGGNAVASWVSRVDEAAVRNTQDVDLLIRRPDFESAKIALEKAGFHYRHSATLDMFLDAVDTKARDAVHVLFAGERVKSDQTPNPDVADSQYTGNYRVLNLEPLVQMKLTSYRLKDRVHLLDMIRLGIIDNSWPPKYESDLAARLQVLLDNPDS